MDRQYLVGSNGTDIIFSILKFQPVGHKLAVPKGCTRLGVYNSQRGGGGHYPNPHPKI